MLCFCLSITTHENINKKKYTIHRSLLPCTSYGHGHGTKLLLVQFDLVAYPLREFPKASDLNITFKVVWMPVASGLYYIYRPRANKLTKCFYFAVWISLLTLIDGMLAAKTELVDYVHFHWSLMAIVYSIIFLSVRGLASWFFRDRKVFRKEANER
ncbi:CBO0543 family protein [Paenibacillus alginolyticus]|uniref:CBO0543 family protein n=2 Tax=Paenibacillus alginolyticus TaxID=59839 RepID=UPI002DBDC25F|nr:CBO0543 family protein [Paenibacillus alginolyticus]